MTFGWDPMRTFAVFAICMYASPEVGEFQGGHGKVELLFGVVQKTPLYLMKVFDFGSLEVVSVVV